MTRNSEQRDDLEFQRSIHELADAFEHRAMPEEAILARLEAGLGTRARRNVLGTVALAVVVLAAAVLGVRALEQSGLGEPAPMPQLSGVFVTTEPDADGRCHAVRLYDTTPVDGRASLWTWTGTPDCSERTSNLSAGLGRADGVRLPAGAGIRVRVSEDAPASLDGLQLVLEIGEGPEASVRAFGSVADATEGIRGISMRQVEELDIPYRPS
jgi:hypothetical protein